jgi:hypothetical protein
MCRPKKSDVKRGRKEKHMPIKIQIMGTAAGPVAICDQCGKRIENASEGLYLWNLEEREDNTMPLYVVHKGLCERLFDPGRQMAWETLQVLPTFLGNNMNLDRKKAEKHIKTWAAAGVYGQKKRTRKKQAPST